MIGRGEPRFYTVSQQTGHATSPRVAVCVMDRLENTALSLRGTNTFGTVYEEIKAQMLCDVLNRYELSYCALRATGHDYEAATQILLKQHQEDNPDVTV